MKEVIQRYLDMIAPMSGPWARVVQHIAAKGSWFESQPLNQEQWDFLEKIDFLNFPHTAGYCWFNSQSAVIHGRRRIKYWEGFTTCLNIPMDHAWCTIDGLVIDNTWPINTDIELQSKHNKRWLDNRTLGVIPQGTAYFGVEIDRRHIFKFWEKEQCAGAILPSLLLEESHGKKPLSNPQQCVGSV